MCNHDSQPISGWYARYWCSKCGVVGCKFGVVIGYGSTASEPYRCATRRGGVRCTELAVVSRNQEMRCKEHGASHRTNGARQKVAGNRGHPVACGISAAPTAADASDLTHAANLFTDFEDNLR